MTNGQEAAFPSVPMNPTHPGLTKREYFAAKALPTVLDILSKMQKLTSHEEAASISCSIADAILKELGEKHE